MLPVEQIREKILTLQSALQSTGLVSPTLLRDIHSSLAADPEVVTLLTDEEVGTIVQGLSKQTQTTIATSTASKRTTKKITLLDL